eukprot:gene9556-10375_t
MKRTSSNRSNLSNVANNEEDKSVKKPATLESVSPSPDTTVVKKVKLSRFQLFKRLLSFISPEAPRIAVGLTALVVNSVTNLSFPWIIGQVVDSAGKENFLEFLTSSAGFFFAGSIASWVRVYCLGTATENIANRLKSQLFESILQQEMEYYESTPLGEIVSLLEHDIQSSAELVTEKIAAALRSLNSALNGSFLLYRTSPRLCGVSLSVIPVVGVAAMTLSRYSRKLSNQLRALQSSTHSYSLERYQNISTVRLNNREKFEIEKFNKMLAESQTCSRRRYNAHGSFMSFLNLSTNASLTAVLWVGGSMIAKKEMTVGSLTSFALQSGFVGLGFSGLSTVYSDIVKSLDSAERVFQIIDSGNENRTKTLSEGNSFPSTTKTIATPPASKRLSATTPRVADLTKAASSIYIENVSFYYKHRPDVLVLKNVSLTIQKNQITCIAGKSGAGKSTLAAILCGLHHPTSGVISYGKNIEIVGEADRGSYNEDKEMLHNLFGVVEQSSSTLFTGTIVDNIAYGKFDASQEEIEAAAKSAHAHDFIKAFPDGYKTQVGQGGCLLSGGQRARIALARALVKQPKYLLLDEPTASLDAESEKELIPPLESLKSSSTIILFTHSDVLKNISDVVHTIEEGAILRKQD